VTASLCILWIDDQLAGIKRFIDVLEIYGHKIVTKLNASDALTEIQANHELYQVVIIDVMLPPGDQKTLFPNGETDEGLSTGILLIDYMIKGKRDEFDPIPNVEKKLVILSGASIERITAKIAFTRKRYKVPYREKGVRNDVVEFAEFIEKHASLK
jgi:CheY-like chemotaxis protein